MKLAVLICSDPKAGEEALGRVFNALALANEAKNNGDTVEINFFGTGSRWPEQLAKADHPAHGVYSAVKDRVAGVSAGCAAAFGASAGVKACGLKELTSNALDGTPGLLSIRHYLADGWQTAIF